MVQLSDIKQPQPERAGRSDGCVCVLAAEAPRPPFQVHVKFPIQFEEVLQKRQQVKERQSE